MCHCKGNAIKRPVSSIDRRLSLLSVPGKIGLWSGGQVVYGGERENRRSISHHLQTTQFLLQIGERSYTV